MRLEIARSELAHLRARYDSGAISPAIYAAIKRLEQDVGWLEHTAKEKKS
jgi:hypothetical protein